MLVSFDRRQSLLLADTRDGSSSEMLIDDGSLGRRTGDGSSGPTAQRNHLTNLGQTNRPHNPNHENQRFLDGSVGFFG